MRLAAVVYELVLGALLALVPWSALWLQNWLFWRAGILRPWLMSGTVRGAVSGVGAAFFVSALGALSRSLAAHLRARESGERAPARVPSPGSRGSA